MAARAAVVDVPHLAAIDGKKLRESLFSQLQYPYLERGLILAYRYNDFDLGGRRRPGTSTSLVRLLVKALTNGVAITLMTRDPYSDDSDPMTLPSLREWHDGLRHLDQAGATVMLHPALHAKVYLFRSQGDRFFFAVGSSNLTYQGMGGAWAECNIRGSHPVDFEEVHRRTLAILNDPKAETLATWETRMRRSPKGLGLFVSGR